MAQMRDRDRKTSCPAFYDGKVRYPVVDDDPSNRPRIRTQHVIVHRADMFGLAQL